MTGQTPISLEAWPLQFPQQWYSQRWWLSCQSHPGSDSGLCSPSHHPVRNLTLGWCFHNRQSQICFDFALYHHCAEQSAHQFLLLYRKTRGLQPACFPREIKRSETFKQNRAGGVHSPGIWLLVDSWQQFTEVRWGRDKSYLPVADFGLKVDCKEDVSKSSNCWTKSLLGDSALSISPRFRELMLACEFHIDHPRRARIIHRLCCYSSALPIPSLCLLLYKRV